MVFTYKVWKQDLERFRSSTSVCISDPAPKTKNFNPGTFEESKNSEGLAKTNDSTEKTNPDCSPVCAVMALNTDWIVDNSFLAFTKTTPFLTRK